jgi:hypothetical protein
VTRPDSGSARLLLALSTLFLRIVS